MTINWVQATHVGRQLYNNMMKVFRGEMTSMWLRGEQYIGMSEVVVGLIYSINHQMTEKNKEE